jgi:hypothetical protein
MLTAMSGAVRGTRVTGHRDAAAGLGLLLAAVLLSGCPAPVTGAERPAEAPSVTSDRDHTGPVTVAAPGGEAAISPTITADLEAGAEPDDSAIDVASTSEGEAVVLLGETAQGPATRLVSVSAEGSIGRSVPVRGLDFAWDLHLLPDGRALITGILSGADAVGFSVVDRSDGSARPVTTLPLDDAGRPVIGASTLSPDGRTVWLYSSTLVDDRYEYLLTGHDVTTGALVAARDLFLEVRDINLPEVQLDPAGLVATSRGEVVLAVNAVPRGAPPVSFPALLVFDTALEPLGEPISLAPRESALVAQSLVVAPDGTLVVLVRGYPVSALITLAPGVWVPERRLELPGPRYADAVAVDSGRALLPGPAGARSIDLTTGATTVVELGCPGTVTTRALENSATGGVWVLGGCFEEGVPPATLWRVP